jgi:hypothetical protein
VSEEAGTRLLTAAEEAAEEEKNYRTDLDKEMKGIPYSRSLEEVGFRTIPDCLLLVYLSRIFHLVSSDTPQPIAQGGKTMTVCS